jgi:hypothetical protein
MTHRVCWHKLIRLEVCLDLKTFPNPTESHPFVLRRMLPYLICLVFSAWWYDVIYDDLRFCIEYLTYWENWKLFFKVRHMISPRYFAPSRPLSMDETTNKSWYIDRFTMGSVTDLDGNTDEEIICTSPSSFNSTHEFSSLPAPGGIPLHMIAPVTSRYRYNAAWKLTAATTISSPDLRSPNSWEQVWDSFTIFPSCRQPHRRGTIGSWVEINQRT